MLKIEKLLEEAGFNKGIYIDAKPDPNSIEKIWRYLKQVGIPVMPINKTHTTIIYSRRAPQGDFQIIDKQLVAEPKAFRIFGKGTKDSPYALVIELESPGLQKLYREYMRGYHLVSDYPEYRPHITVTYDIERVMPGLKKLTPKQKNTIENIFSKMIPELPKQIRFVKQSVQELDTNWR